MRPPSRWTTRPAATRSSTPAPQPNTCSTPTATSRFEAYRLHSNEGHNMAHLTLDDARTIIAAAEKKADEIGQPVNIAVVDAGGNLVAHVRQDGAWIGSIDISINKAFTSRAFDIATK